MGEAAVGFGAASADGGSTIRHRSPPLFVRALLFALVLALAGAPAAVAAEPTTSTAKVAPATKKPKKKRNKTVARPAAPLSCANTGLLPTTGNLELIRDALVCLHNQTRAQGGIGTLAASGGLAAAASGHASDMVARGYFEHETPEGGHFQQRVLATGYARGGYGWELGENLIWANGELATPAALMRAWLESAGHRANIVKPEFRELGLSAAYGTPEGGGGVTVVAEFGVRG